MTEKIFPILKTKRLVLREFRLEDAGAVFDMYSRQIFTRYLPDSPMETIAEAEEKVKARMDLFHRYNACARWAITLRENSGRVIGSCGYYYPQEMFHSIEMGYDLHPDHWRQGIMTEALTAMINFGYSEDFFFPLNRIRAITYPKNEASRKLLEKLGFKQEGVLREYAYWDGTYHDHLLFALIKRDWFD